MCNKFRKAERVLYHVYEGVQRNNAGSLELGQLGWLLCASVYLADNIPCKAFETSFSTNITKMLSIVVVTI